LNKNWDGIYIESDKTKFHQLVDNFKDFKDRIDCVNAMVGFDDNNNLDTLIESHSQKREFDFVSIDVDGFDYFIFEKVVKYLPKVICIEVNAGHDPEYDIIIPQNIAEDNIGQSIKVISDLASKKGYFPLCYNGNLFLIKNEFEYLFSEYKKSIKNIYLDFLNHLQPHDIAHLKKTFIDTNVYNKFLFKNDTLYNFIMGNRTKKNWSMF